MFQYTDAHRVAMLIPHRNFHDEEYLQPRNALVRAGISVVTCSTSLAPARGMLGFKVNPNLLLTDVQIEDYDGLILVGGSGAPQYWDDFRVHELAWKFRNANKPLGAIGNAVVTLTKCGIIESPAVIIRDVLQNTLNSTEEQRRDTRREVRQNLLSFADARFARTFGEQFAAMLRERQGEGSALLSV